MSIHDLCIAHLMREQDLSRIRAKAEYHRMNSGKRQHLQRKVRVQYDYGRK